MSFAVLATSARVLPGAPVTYVVPAKPHGLIVVRVEREDSFEHLLRIDRLSQSPAAKPVAMEAAQEGSIVDSPPHEHPIEVRRERELTDPDPDLVVQDGAFGRPVELEVSVSYPGDIMIRKRSEPIDEAMESALRPGHFVDYGESWDFVSALDTVEERIGRLIKSQPARAVELLETFIAGCYEKAEEIDDSSGSFGQFVEGLFCSWIKARQAAKGDPHDIVQQLLGWMNDDDYGFCHGIEREAVKALNRAGLKAFAETAHEEWTGEFERVRVQEKGDKMTRGSARFRWLSDVLRAIYAQQRDPERYLAIAEEMGLVSHSYWHEGDGNCTTTRS